MQTRTRREVLQEYLDLPKRVQCDLTRRIRRVRMSIRIKLDSFNQRNIPLNVM